MKKINLLFLGVIILFTNSSLSAQMAGSYTIDSANVTGGTNYQTFTAAITDLTTNGVSGSVIFSVLQGTYSEQISIPSITGSSVTNTITFKGLGDNTVITAAPTTTNLPVFGLDATSHIIVDSLKIEVTSSQGWGVHFMGLTDSVVIQNCHIIVPAVTDCYGVMASSSLTSITASANCAEYVSLINNYIEGGKNGVLIKGVTSTYATDITFIGNTIVDFIGKGIDVSNSQNVTIMDNAISSSVSTANYALRFWDAGDNCTISGNKFYLGSNVNNTRVVAVAMGVTNPAGDALLPIIISNNFIQYEGSNSSTPCGLLLKNKAHVKVYHNTIKVNNAGTNANCMWFDANNTRALEGLEVRNNILSLDNSGSGQFFYASANGASFDNMIIEYNNYYAPSSYFKIKLPNGVSSTITTYSSFTAYQANSYGYSTGAMNVDPGFVSATDLHATSAAMNDSGVVISSITTDIDGEARSLTTPDIGADEYAIAPVICLGPTQTIIECDGFIVTVGSNNYSTTGVYTDTLVGAGCDSIVVTDLTIKFPGTFTQTLSECDGYSITVGSNTYSATGVYMDTLVAGAFNGCDSIITTDLTINSISTFTQTLNECTGYSITVNGNTYTTTGVYNDTLVAGALSGCDSVVVTDLTVSTSIFTQTLNECTGYSITVNGNTYTTTGVYNDTLVAGASTGCDSVVVTDLTVSNSTFTQTLNECTGYSVTVNGNTYTTTGVYNDTLVAGASTGCDSIVITDLTVSSSIVFTQLFSECLGYSVVVNGNTYSTTGIYHDTIAGGSAAGCDSVIVTDLTINTSTSATDTQIACGTYTWIDGITYTSSNTTAMDTLLNAAGCDSIVTLDLTINTSTSATDTQIACDTYTWIDGITYTLSNTTAMDTLLNAAGCDSIVTLDLTINTSTSATDTQIACDTYTWINGITYTSSNTTAMDTLLNAAGCDSIITLDLTINTSTSATDTQIACGTYTWIDGITYTSNNTTAMDTLLNAAGCDSIITLDLTINTSTSATDTQIACDTYTWINGITYTSSNTTAMDTLLNAAGCDSIVTLDLTINTSTSAMDTQIACDTYTWINGITYTSSNTTAMDTLLNAAGCDSIVTLDLTINTSTSATDTQIACDTYTWINGITYTSSNTTAMETLVNAAGCDSIVTLNLTIKTSTSATDTQVACDTYTWINGITYTSSNTTAMETLVNAAGCDSIVTLDLTINTSTSATDTQIACDTYTWINGITYTSSNTTAMDTLLNAAGCDSIVTLDLTINTSTSATDTQVACGTYSWIDGVTYTSSNTTATYTIANAAGCDSVVMLDLTINTVDTSTTTVGFVITSNATGAVYQWIDCDNGNSPITDETNASYTVTVSGNYAVVVTENGCTDTSSCVNVIGVGINEKNLNPMVSLYPNPTSGNVNLTLNASVGKVQINVLDIAGKSYLKMFSTTKNVDIDLSQLESGVYFIRVSNANNQQVIKLVKL